MASSNGKRLSLSGDDSLTGHHCVGYYVLDQVSLPYRSTFTWERIRGFVWIGPVAGNAEIKVCFS